MVLSFAPSAPALGGLLQIAIRQQSPSKKTPESITPLERQKSYLLLISFSFIQLVSIIYYFYRQKSSDFYNNSE